MALGIVLTPYGKIPGAFPSAITGSYGGNGTFVEGDVDPYFNRRGEPGFYTDTFLGAPSQSLWSRVKNRLRWRRGLGAIPTDFQIGMHNLNYTPVMSNWIHAKEGYIQPPPWTPPRGLGEGVIVPGSVGPAPATVEDVVLTMNAHNDRVFALTLVSTTAVAISAMITVFRTLKLIREGKD